MKPDSYSNRKGETVISYAVFKRLDADKVSSALHRYRPRKNQLRRRERRIANGTLKESQ